jgi:hypothetical protein
VRLFAGIALLVGFVLGIVLRSWAGPLTAVDAAHEWMYLFGVLFLVTGIIDPLGASLASVYARLISIRTRCGATNRDSTADPDSSIETGGSASRWLVVAIFGVVLLALGSLLDGYRFADGGVTDRPPAAPTSTSD